MDDAIFARIHRLQSRSGASVAYRHQPATGPARAILLVCHGLAEHAGRYGRFAEAMSRQGLEVYAHDHRGHGRTTAPDAPTGRFSTKDGATKTVADLKAMRDMAVERHPGLPVILFGHAMGGLIALNASITHPQSFDGLSIWNTRIDPGIEGRFVQLVLKAEKMLKGSDVPSIILSKTTFAAWNDRIAERRTGFDWLSRDRACVDAYVSDPLCGLDASVSLWQDIFSLMFRATANLSYMPKDLPFHLVGGGEDPATEGGKHIVLLAGRLRKLGYNHVSEAVYPGMRHETLHDKGWEIPVADFSRWCASLLSNGMTL